MPGCFGVDRVCHSTLERDLRTGGTWICGAFITRVVRTICLHNLLYNLEVMVAKNHDQRHNNAAITVGKVLGTINEGYCTFSPFHLFTFSAEEQYCSKSSVAYTEAAISSRCEPLLDAGNSWKVGCLGRMTSASPWSSSGVLQARSSQLPEGLP